VRALGGLITGHPLGVGVGTVGPAAGFGRTVRAMSTYNSEDEWNFLVVETGIAGLVVYVAFVLRLLWLALTRIRRVPDPRGRLYLAALAAPLFGMFVADFSGPTSAAPPTAPFLWLVAGVLSYRLVTRQPARPVPEALRVAVAYPSGPKSSTALA
jgi:O-antigen ligase